MSCSPNCQCLLCKELSSWSQTNPSLLPSASDANFLLCRPHGSNLAGDGYKQQRQSVCSSPILLNSTFKFSRPSMKLITDEKPVIKPPRKCRQRIPEPEEISGKKLNSPPSEEENTAQDILLLNNSDNILDTKEALNFVEKCSRWNVDDGVAPEFEDLRIEDYNVNSGKGGVFITEETKLGGDKISDGILKKKPFVQSTKGHEIILTLREPEDLKLLKANAQGKHLNKNNHRKNKDVESKRKEKKENASEDNTKGGVKKSGSKTSSCVWISSGNDPPLNKLNKGDAKRSQESLDKILHQELKEKLKTVMCVSENENKECVRPGGGSREMLPSTAYSGYQPLPQPLHQPQQLHQLPHPQQLPQHQIQQHQPQQPHQPHQQHSQPQQLLQQPQPQHLQQLPSLSHSLNHNEFPQRSTSSQGQPHITGLRSPNVKLADEKTFSPCPSTNAASPVRSCPTPSKVLLSSPQNITTSVGPALDVDASPEQLVPERDTNPSCVQSIPVEVCTNRPESPAKIMEEPSGSRGFKAQPHRTSVTQAVMNKIGSAVTATISSRHVNTGTNRSCNSTGSGGRSHLHHHLSVEELRLIQVQRRQDSNGSSSDDGTRSSGHASMSDGHLSSSPPAERHQHYRSPLNSVPEDDRLSASVMRAARKTGHNRSRHRATPAKLVPSGSGLEDIKLAIQQLTMRSHTSNAGYSTSTYSSLSGSESSEPAVRRLMRHSSLETINTNVTSADEFVWVDSHNRLVELQHLPWSNHDVLKVIQNGRLKEQMERVSMETVPRLSYLLQRALVRISREAQRLSRPLGLCSKHEINSALRITLCPALADSCTKACLRSAAMFAVSGDLQLKQSKSCRAGLQLSVGRFQRWMADVRLGKFIHEYAAIYLTAGMENLLEEIILQCLPSETDTVLTASMFEHAIANNGELWGLLQPYAHLNAGRIASGALAMPRWPSVSSMSSETTHTSSGKSMEQSLLTTCVGSVQELTDLLARTSSRPLTWTPVAVQALFYFMRCSQLEHAEHTSPIQELVYERAYVVLPPLVEWLRVTTAHAEHRHSTILDQDDVMQAARLLLPGVDCPIRQICTEETVCTKRQGEEVECVRKLKSDLAFRMLSSGRSDLVPHALQLLPASKKLNSFNENGLSPLMLAVLRHDEAAVRCLLDAGADPDLETPPHGSNGCASVHAETQHWTALTYASLQGTCNLARLLLERGAHVEGGAHLSEDKCTLTPLQVAVASGHNEMVLLLLSHGAHTFLSTLLKDSLCYSGAAQRGCYSALSVAATHGQRTILHKLLSHPLNTNNKEVLSLEEILAEGASQLTADRRGTKMQMTSCSNNSSSDSNACSVNLLGSDSSLKLNKAQIKSLQEAMYHSAENNHLDMTLDLRNLGVPWTLHCWMHTLGTAHEQRLDNIIDQLLQDFLQVWPDDYSTQFVDECLPLLFNIFRFSKNEGTTLLLADIFSTCFGWEAIKSIRDTSFSGGTRIDPKFVNNPELSDVQFRVEGRVFYGHKIVLVTWSPRFRAMLSSKLCDGSPPVVHINDIRYHIFQLVMQYLYNGGCENLQVEPADVLELMAAANFFQLDGLLRFCEAQCSSMVDLDNIVSMYIHAKVYNATELLEYCQGFLLQNMVALLTYDDSVKRLLFGKKLHNHDVLAGLLLTLQARIKARNVGSSAQRSIKPK